MRELHSLAGHRLCLLNWRDRGHPAAGGAETYCEEVAARFASAGAQVTLFTSTYPGATPVELRDGFRIVRRGGTLGVYASAAAHLVKTSGQYDAIIDFQNGIPYFAPVFAPRTPTVMVVHHIHQEQFDHRFPWPASAVGRALEGPVSRMVYGQRPIAAVSPSTRRDVRLRLGLRGPIHVVPNGVSPIQAPRRRSDQPRIVTVTRLAPHKRLHLLVEAVAELASSWPTLELHLAGTGPDQERIQVAIRALGLGHRVKLYGRITNQERDELLSSAWLTALPSETEGWGLTILEANSAGVPAVTLDVPGLRDAVVPGGTGWLAGDVSRFAATMAVALDAVSEPGQAELWGRRCRDWAATFSWDRTADELARVVLAEMARSQHAPRTDRRVNRDVSVVGWVVPRAETAAAAALLQARLRSTDRVTVRGTRVGVIVHGADEALAQRLISRAGVDGAVHLRVMRPHERLLETASWSRAA